jgi:hypothetical protein
VDQDLNASANTHNNNTNSDDTNSSKITRTSLNREEDEPRMQLCPAALFPRSAVEVNRVFRCLCA